MGGRALSLLPLTLDLQKHCIYFTRTFTSTLVQKKKIISYQVFKPYSLYVYTFKSLVVWKEYVVAQHIEPPAFHAGVARRESCLHAPSD